jgi:multidrug efflux pump subunit AcrB
MNAPDKLGVSGRIASFFLHSHLTPLLALMALLLGMFAVAVTPREEEPQIDVTMANVLVPFPGAGAGEVERLVAGPAEQILARMNGVEHVLSMARPGMAVLTVQFKVGVTRNDALVRLYDTVHSHQDWLPPGLGTLPPLVKPKGIDDVPIVVLTLHSKRADVGGGELERVAHSVEADLKRVPGTRDVASIGGPGRAVNVEIDPARLAASGVTILDVGQALRSANSGAPVGYLLAANRAVDVEVTGFLQRAEDVAELVVGSHAGKPVFLSELAQIRDGAPPAERYVWHGSAAGERAAVMLAVTKKPGENAIDVADAVQARVAQLGNAVIPADVEVSVSRNYGETANDKASKLIQKLLFATLSVVALVGMALGRREAAIVGVAVVLTLAATLFASWAWGFTLNRVSLFALIFSIGILVDDAIVVVENIHRHQLLDPDASLAQLIPGAVDEVGGPTILATLTVIAALLPMAFVSGLMGPYMAPIPINASMGMLLSLAIAIVITPWLARVWMHKHPAAGGDQLSVRLAPLFGRIFRPLLAPARAGRAMLGAAIAGALALAVLLPLTGLVVLKMLPFDNKSEFQLVLDMPPGTPVEKTAGVLHEIGAHLATLPEVVDYVASAGSAAPINFNGLVRQYYLREGSEVGDIQVRLLGQQERSEQSHAIATRVRPALAQIAQRSGGRLRVVEVPPGPPVQAPIVAEVYGPDEDGRLALARQVREVFRRTPGVVDIDSTALDDAKRIELQVDRRKAATLGVAPASVTATLQAALSGLDASFLHDGSRHAVPTRVQLGPQWHGSLETLLQMKVRSQSGALVAVRELVDVGGGVREQALYHKDLLPVAYVTGDMAGAVDSPLYGMFAMRAAVAGLKAPDGGNVAEYLINQPEDAYRGYAVKWDGEWQITYETFRDMGAAYAVGLVLIYLLVVAQFGSYLTPLIIMAPIPLTAIGVMPGHAILGAQFTATSMIGMIALAGIIVRNSILLVDFIELEVSQGRPLAEAIVRSAAARAQPIVLTGLAAMIGALFILNDPIFNGLAIALVFGISVSTMLTLVVIPLLYYLAHRSSSEGGR